MVHTETPLHPTPWVGIISANRPGEENDGMLERSITDCSGARCLWTGLSSTHSFPKTKGTYNPNRRTRQGHPSGLHTHLCYISHLQNEPLFWCHRCPWTILRHRPSAPVPDDFSHFRLTAAVLPHRNYKLCSLISPLMHFSGGGHSHFDVSQKTRRGVRASRDA